MYQLLIADDEDTIRDGLQAIVNWEKLGFHVQSTFEDGREIKFTPKQGRLGHIGYPFLIRPFRTEISCQQVWRNLADFSTVRTILFHSHHTF